VAIHPCRHLEGVLSVAGRRGGALGLGILGAAATFGMYELELLPAIRVEATSQ
jgi:hypothetical protein